MSYSKAFNSFLPEELKNKYIFEHDAKASNNNEVVFRSTISSGEEVESFIKDFSNASNTQWIVRRCNKKSYTKISYHKSWVCQHSSYRKKCLSKRDLKCGAKISVTIKKATINSKKKDPYLSTAVPRCCKIVMNLTHSHDLNNADTLKMKRVSEEAKTLFSSYFDDGVNPKTAKRYHENMLLSSENVLVDSADAAKNPTDRQVYHMHEKWCKINLGAAGNPCEKLMEKKQLYEEKGATLIVNNDGTWAVLIVTAIMKRVQSLKCASEIIFVDTTASCENTNSALTVMLIATKVGALPIAAFLHENQTTETYLKAFSMLKIHFPLCFGGKEFPAVFMTDDSKAEKNALLEVWEKSAQLLCHFHVAQAEWRWICSSKDIPKDTKPLIMKRFQSIMYATSEKDLLKNLNDLITFAEPFPSYIERLENYFKRRTEWTFFDRQKHIIRGHNTNNFAESSIRIIKDVVLCRTKALNAVALTDFIVDAWEKYFCFKLLDFINGRRDSFLASRMDKTYDVPLSSCIQLTPQLYLLPSTTDSNIMYEINVDIGFCTCTSGRTGAFCKHQCFLFKKLNLELPNVPVLNLSERLQFAYIASGKKDLNAEFYKGNSEENSSVWIVSELPQENDQSCASKMEISETYRNIDHFASMEEKQELLSEFKRLLELPQSKNSVCKLTSAIKNKKSPEDMKSTLTTMALAVSAKNYTHSRTKKIKVQPTSICRRLKRGTNCIPKNVLQKKRLHNISKNINKNVPNAK